ncbi:RBBP9/YdeN family alpha/beta hydrolase [Psychromonas hadalis]|uniref:RBBP9/YdeN family alpha/beta hydrolase n=1 Tax=Psychromonas hadalis TaxID=211669 RepID=UPI0003B64506|nr:alpha/beta hydrolase [Psychromonas hadalis]
MTITIVNVPGYTNAGPAHWQTLLEEKLANVKRVQQQDWLSPDRELWIQGIENTVSKIDGDIILVGHSCGAVAIAQWALACDSHKVKGALLVAPADIDRESAIAPIHVQRPLPEHTLPFTTKLIYSDNDEHSSVLRSEKMGKDWGSELILVKGASHFHTDAGFGEWPEAEKWIEQLAGMRCLTLYTRHLE